ncbi:MAG: hypothetical protein HZB53_10570 [Chloroflexi bacterium]|nr:hypothetical protein [Chloroflexota bacterium]
MLPLSPIPFAQCVWALPSLTILAPSERFYADNLRAYKRMLDWMRQALLHVRRWLPARALVFVGDNSYASIAFLWRMTQLANPIKMVVRFRMDAALYAPAPSQNKRAPSGRPAKKGKRLPALEQAAARVRTPCATCVVRIWYGEFKRQSELTAGTTVWYHGGLPVLPIRWVIVRDRLGHFKTQTLLCTDPSVSARQIVEWFVQRLSCCVAYATLHAESAGTG